MNKLTGYIIVFFSIVLYALIPSLMKKTSGKLPAFTIMAISMFVLFLCSFIFSIIYEKSLSLKAGDFKGEILILIFVGIINTTGFFLAIQGYKYMPLWQQTLFGLFTPVFVSIFAYIILHEQISPKLFAGLLVMGIGLFIAIK